MELISREEAIKAITGWETDPTDEELEQAIINLPTIEERKEGEWVYESCSRLIDETDEGRVYTIEKRWHCSQCGLDKGFRMYRPNEKYCPNCGAKMEGVE